MSSFVRKNLRRESLLGIKREKRWVSHFTCREKNFKCSNVRKLKLSLTFSLYSKIFGVPQ